VLHAVDDCERIVKSIGKRCGDKNKLLSSKRLLSLYVIKLSLMTGDDVEENVKKVIANMIKEGDPVST
jgi:hypothetical protein